jgi:hypothetical protein
MITLVPVIRRGRFCFLGTIAVFANVTGGYNRPMNLAIVRAVHVFFIAATVSFLIYCIFGPPFCESPTSPPGPSNNAATVTPSALFRARFR